MSGSSEFVPWTQDQINAQHYTSEAEIPPEITYQGRVDDLHNTRNSRIKTAVSMMVRRAFEPQTGLGELMPNNEQAAKIFQYVQERRGIAWFLPAHNEEGNIRETVTGIVNCLKQMGYSSTVIVVDDGSTDNTRSITSALTKEFANVRAVHHSVNRGYGGALKTGFFEAASSTDHELVVFCDSDGQFKPTSLNALLLGMTSQEADFCIGKRIRRADSLKRLIMGRAWHWLSSTVLDYKAEDVDCGFKVFTAALIDDISGRLVSDNAAISPELIARAQRGAARS